MQQIQTLATQLTNYATAIINDYQKRSQMTESCLTRSNTEMRMLYNPQLKGAFNFVPGVMAMVCY
jgi:ABC-2 type transport system permease protein